MRWLTVCLGLLIFSGLNAQPICGFDDVHNKLLKTNPSYKKMLDQTDLYIQDFISKHPLSPSQFGNPLYTIPVVVHIVHTGDAVGTIYNPTDATINATIAYLNQVYDGTAAGLFGGVGDIQIQFQLAQRDPNCNPSNGIDRVDGSGLDGYLDYGVNRSGSSGTDELALKDASRWDPAQYYNIWVVNKIDGKDGTSGQFVAGFAYFPGSSSLLDGTIMLATQFRTSNKVLPHEIGHAFNLYHPFQGSNLNTTCPSNSDCTLQGDRVCDTDPVSQNVNSSGVNDFSCRTGNNPCTNTPYSINTENNIMGYTNCFTLFTTGQKARMLASMSLASRASLVNSLAGTPTYLGTTQCSPKINFEMASSQVTETTVSTSDCRGYKDYTYNLVIGNSPSVAATVLLQATGSATPGADYILTTNGSFIDPSVTINFPAGQRTNQTFQLRVFDDAAIEPTENILLGFTVNSNGGNASKGTAITSLEITIISNDLPPQPSYSNSTQLGTYSINLGSNSASAPFNAKLSAQKTTFLYQASELQAAGLTAGNISSFGIFLNKNSKRAFSNVNISMGQTTRDYLVDNGSAYGVAVTTVKTMVSYSTIDGLNEFALDNPFAWDGQSNIAVQICFSNGSSASTDFSDVTQGYSDGGTDTQGNIYFGSVNCSTAYGSVSYYSQGYKPVATFSISKTGAQVESTLSASSTAYLGPFDDVYFYSAQGNIMARIKNLSSFDYGCTQVLIDRTGTGAKNYTGTQATNAVADKTFRVVPTNNNPNGAYEITLYYKKAEINGWQTATGQSWSAAKILKTPNAVSTYTQGQVPVGSVTAASAIGGAYDVDSTLKASFNNGFSGFAVGNPSLSITTYTFNGNGLWTNTANWTNGQIPPDILPSAAQIVIDPVVGGQCVLNKQQTISTGASLKVNSNKVFVIQGNLQYK